MANKRQEEPSIEIRQFRSIEEINQAIAKLERRIAELTDLNVQEAVLRSNGADSAAKSNVRQAILEIFGPNSPEFREHRHIDLWAGPMYMGMSPGEIIEGKRRGTVRTVGILKGLVNRLEEKKQEFSQLSARQTLPDLRRSMQPNKAISILKKLITDAQVLPGERWDSSKRTGWRDTARVALEQAGVSSTLLGSFDASESMVLVPNMTDEELRKLVNSNLSRMIAVLQSAVNTLGWEVEEDQPNQVSQVGEPRDEDLTSLQDKDPSNSTISRFNVGDGNFLHVDGEVWRDTVVDDETPLRKGKFFGQSLEKVSKLSFQDLAAYFDEIEISLPGVQKELGEWEFAYAEVEFYGRGENESLTVAFRIEYDLEFWAKQYSLSDLASAVEQVLEESGTPFSYWQRSQNTCIEGFGVSFARPRNAKIEDALAKERELQQLASAIKAHLSQHETRSLNLVFDFPAPIKTACEQYLLYFVQFLSDLGIEAKAEIKEQASKVLFSVSPVDEKQALARIYEALQTYLGLPRSPDLPMAASQVPDVAVAQLRANVLHLQSQLMLAKAAIEMKNATLDASDAHIALLQDRIDLREFQPKPESKGAEKEELVKGLVSVKKYDFKFLEINLPELLRKLKRKF